MSNETIIHPRISQAEIALWSQNVVIKAESLHKPIKKPSIITSTPCMDKLLAILYDLMLRHVEVFISRNELARRVGCTPEYISFLLGIAQREKLVSVLSRRAINKTNIYSYGSNLKNYQIFNLMKEYFPVLHLIPFFDIPLALERFKKTRKEYIESLKSNILFYLSSPHVNRSLFIKYLKEKKNDFKENHRMSNLRKYGHEFTNSQERYV